MAKKQLPIANKMTTEAAMPTKGEDMAYKAKYALEDIERAEMHRKDKSLMSEVKKLAKSKIKALGKIC